MRIFRPLPHENWYFSCLRCSHSEVHPKNGNLDLKQSNIPRISCHSIQSYLKVNLNLSKSVFLAIEFDLNLSHLINYKLKIYRWIEFWYSQFFEQNFGGFDLLQ